MAQLPRALRLLRIEDKPGVQSGLPRLTEIARIGTWGEFIRELAQRHASEPSWVSSPPDIISVDFGFEKDMSLPGIGQPARSAAGRELAFEWSSQLGQPNTGVVIAAAVLSVVGSGGSPVAIALHSQASGQVCWDLTSALIVGQILALGGLWNAANELPLDYLSRYFNVELKQEPDDAIKIAARAYRAALLRAFGVDTPQPPTLFPDPDSVAKLTEALSSDQSVSDINQRLDNVGLLFHDRDGRGDHIDLRSLFLDKVEHHGTQSVLRLTAAGPSDENAAPEDPQAFVAAVHASIARTCIRAAEVVETNSLGRRDSAGKREADFTRLLVLVFGMVADLCAQVAPDDTPWDPVMEETADGNPSLLDQLSHVVICCHDAFEDLDGEGDVNLVLRRLARPSRSAVATHLRQAPAVAVDNLVKELTKRRLVKWRGERFRLAIDVPTEDAVDRLGVVQRLVRRTPKLDRVAVAKLVGAYNADSSEHPSYNNIFRRHCEPLIADYKRFLNEWDSAHRLPTFVRPQVKWYLDGKKIDRERLPVDFITWLEGR